MCFLHLRFWASGSEPDPKQAELEPWVGVARVRQGLRERKLLIFLGLFAAAFQGIPYSGRCNCNAPESRSPAQTPQAAIRFAFIRSSRALTCAAARSMTTAPLKLQSVHGLERTSVQASDVA